MSRFDKGRFQSDKTSSDNSPSDGHVSGRTSPVRDLRTLIDEEIARKREAIVPQDHHSDRASDARLAKIAGQELRDRHLRTKYFAPSLFGEPGWEMLLGLYISDTIEGRVPTTRLADMAGAPLTTALRWIDYLERAQLVKRQAHAHDRRIVWVALTDLGRDLLAGYFNETKPTAQQ